MEGGSSLRPPTKGGSRAQTVPGACPRPPGRRPRRGLQARRPASSSRTSPSRSTTLVVAAAWARTPPITRRGRRCSAVRTRRLRRLAGRLERRAQARGPARSEAVAGPPPSSELEGSTMGRRGVVAGRSTRGLECGLLAACLQTRTRLQAAPPRAQRPSSWGPVTMNAFTLRAVREQSSLMCKSTRGFAIGLRWRTFTRRPSRLTRAARRGAGSAAEAGGDILDGTIFFFGR
mmetsp:Transcript_25240/g.62564  ORF Transcript_25240/g.62564 Transcript_25240/m.62564 type:complete len:232 (+) Transcript_25240:118-813(+)